MDASLKYSDSTDKSYGLSGAAIGLYIFDGEAFLGDITLDPESGEPLGLTPDFYFAGNPRISAKSVWKMMLENFHLTQAMAISNLLCRRIVAAQQEDVPRQEQHLLRKYIFEEGKQTLSLDQDEMEKIFDKDYLYLRRIFSHPGVRNVAALLADTLRTKEAVRREEALEILSLLRRL